MVCGYPSLSQKPDVSTIVQFDPASKSIRIGLGFNQKYNSEKDYGDITITVVDTSNPAGYLDIGTVKYFRTCILFDFSLFFAYSFKNLITDNDNLD